jgi:hypothetical protein
MRDKDAVGAASVFRVTAAAIAATGHDSLESLQRFLADAVASPADTDDVADVEILGHAIPVLSP